jgi:hypothetical protein
VTLERGLAKDLFKPFLKEEDNANTINKQQLQ